jgi:hypothetical protein
VIGVPWDHLSNPWEFVYLAHEVAHDLEADLKLRHPLGASLDAALTAGKVPADRAACWKAWQREAFADLLALRLVGPAFADGLASYLLLPSGIVVRPATPGKYPPHFLRILLNTRYARDLVPGRAELQAHADGLRDSWLAVYGKQQSLAPYESDFAHVIAGLMQTKLPQLKDRTVEDLVPFNAGDDAGIRELAGYLKTGEDRPPDRRPRHVIAACRLAAKAVAREDGQIACGPAKVANLTMETVKRTAPRDKRGGVEEAGRLASYARMLGLIGPDAGP